MSILKPQVSLNVRNVDQPVAFVEKHLRRQRQVRIEDPDGNSWEVFVVTADAPVMRDDTNACCVTTGAVKMPVACRASELGHAD